MVVEIAHESYNRLPEASYRDPRYIDISHWADGERTRGVAQKDLGRRTARATFSTLPTNVRDREFSDRPVTILLPGTLVPANAAFRAQLPVIEKTSKTVLVDYSEDRFSRKMLRSQMADFIDSPLAQGKGVNLVGFSFGASNVLDFVFEEPELEERISGLVLLGSVYSSQDLKRTPGYEAIRLAKRAGLVRESIMRPAMPILRKGVKVADDPALVFQSQSLRDSKKAVSHRAMTERTASVLTRAPIEDQDRILRIPTLIVFWDDDESSRQRQDIIVSRFFKPTVVRVSGKHGWTSTSASEINPPIKSFFQLQQERLLAAA